MTALTEEQRKALHDAYTTLRAIYASRWTDDVTKMLCATSVSLLAAAFPSVSELEAAIEAAAATGISIVDPE